MSARARLALYATGMAALFGAAFLVGGAVIAHPISTSWARSGHAGHQAGAQPVRGVSLSAGDLMLDDVAAPPAVGVQGTLSFRVQSLGGVPVTRYAIENAKKLHLIVVRSDGTEFRHVHPTMSAEGRWSIPWAWNAAGTYRVFADFVPEGGNPTVLTYALNVGGMFTPDPPPSATNVSRTDGFTVTIDGPFTAQSPSRLIATVTRDGQPVTTLQPYLGAYGHLVVLREGDLAYLHAHPENGAASAGSASPAQIAFTTEPPTPGRYLLYLDFQVNGRVHTAQFVRCAAEQSSQPATHQ
ncbi:hypothetical protein DE4576_00516 [Mycobacterium marinum]|uniref:hypothetical protein n=1 Tax=Mycobacterium marinum TaxID=1781 RepID=UPI000E3C226C|nr:hypothetical protein [Mycobacterium marinum]RFZ69717.1 hypothetical protein DE4576_00516 [Mycobacterium marinum]